MPTHKLLLLAGDGIGPEVMAEVKRLLAYFAKAGIAKFEVDEALVGGGCYDAHKVSITEETMAKAHAADAVIFGAVGGPKWDNVGYDVRPEAGLLRLRKDLGLFANIRPAICYPALADSSSLKREAVDGLDIIILRESPTSAMGKSARSTRKSTTPTRSSALPASVLSSPASGATKSRRWKSATS
jgi:3-isopropylmalate dehydrogenase